MRSSLSRVAHALAGLAVLAVASAMGACSASKACCSECSGASAPVIRQENGPKGIPQFRSCETPKHLTMGR